ncbi:MAG: HK97 family phage prohead protease [Alphaproteobacteria bacterium]|nr:HK97 family phage prohead protease [Alphaproteobacteria bacterium]
MRIFVPLEKCDEEKRLAIGYASTPALDSQGEIVKREAVEAALPDYMRFANIREMHLPSAVGVAAAADVDARGLHIQAKVVDDDAWEKVKQGVYKGFSIGGRVTSRDPADHRVITGIELTEISLVDRPANPEAVIDVYKADLAKQGRRNSAADLERIQRVHDTSVELGASCAHSPAGADQADAADAAPDADDPAKTACSLDLAKHASLAPVRGRGLLCVGELQSASLTQSWVRGSLER